MPETKKLKPEELEKEPELIRSYAPHFAVLGLLFLGSFVWSLWDEVVTRRPWKRYQAEARLLEEDLLKKDLAKEQGRLDEQKLKEAEEAHKKAVEDFDNNPEVQKLREDLQQTVEKLYVAQQDFQRVRSTFQEMEYWKEECLLFFLGLEFQEVLDGGEISADLRQQFDNHKIPLSEKVTVVREKDGQEPGKEEANTWRITDQTRIYTLLSAHLVLISPDFSAPAICG